MRNLLRRSFGTPPGVSMARRSHSAATMRRCTATNLHVVTHRPGTGSAVVALRAGQEAYVGDAIALRARLAQRLDELQRRLATYRTFDEPEAAEAADRI